ncbi:MAG: YdiU family protein [Thiohalobacterales bacterium]
MLEKMHFHFNNRYIRLGRDFYVSTRPTPATNPELIAFNEELAAELGLSAASLNSTEGTAIFAGNVIPAGAEPLAMAYSGHQFGHFNPQLGDGRAILLGEIDSPGGQSFDVQLKGSGRTFYSRDGDGRSALGPVLREYLVSEAMAKLGVPTTRALAAVTTGEEVVRQQLLPGGIITRIAESFVRVGTFQYFADRGDVEAIRKLADYVIERSYPRTREAENPYIALLEAIVDSQAALIARWMQLGFIHGVMNTDNMSIAGETIDYGPCAFMDAYAHDRVYSSIDHGKRYAYDNQPSIGLWNITRLAETLVPLLAEETEAAVEIAQDALKRYIVLYRQYWLAGMRDKTGLTSELDGDRELVEELFDIMESNKADFTLVFYYLSQSDVDSITQDRQIKPLFPEPGQFDAWAVKWRNRLRKEAGYATGKAKMQAVNPVYIPRNHQVEAAIRAAEDHGDFSVFHDLHEVLQFPYKLQVGKQAYMRPPEPDEVVKQTFCGT